MRSLLPGIIVPLLLIGWSGGTVRRRPWAAAAVLGWYSYGLVHTAVGNVRLPHEWDYACFWLYGHIAAAHLNVYDPAVFGRFATPFVLDAEFRRAVLDVGFPYPPPTIALFLPLGFIASVPGGLTLWYVVQFAALALAAHVLARTFMPSEGWRGTLLVAAIVVALPAGIANVGDAQTNFLVLLLIALGLSGRGTGVGMVWQTLAMWIKPYAAMLLLLDIVRGNTRRLTIAAATIVASFLAALLALGPTTVGSYFRANPAGREPSFTYVESVNQSLLAVVLRLQSTLPEHVAVLHQPVYLVLALALTAITVVLCARKPAADDIAFAAMLSLGLIVYPGTLAAYGVVLVIPILVLWRYRLTLPGRTATAAACIAFALVCQSSAVQFGFGANLVMWIACTYLLVVERGRSAASWAPQTAGPVAANLVRG